MAAEGRPHACDDGGRTWWCARLWLRWGVWLSGSAAGKPVDARFRTAAPAAHFTLDVHRDGAAPLREVALKVDVTGRVTGVGMAQGGERMDGEALQVAVDVGLGGRVSLPALRYRDARSAHNRPSPVSLARRWLRRFGLRSSPLLGTFPRPVDRAFAATATWCKGTVVDEQVGPWSRDHGRKFLQQLTRLEAGCSPRGARRAARPCRRSTGRTGYAALG